MTKFSFVNANGIPTIIERYKIQSQAALERVVDFTMSNIACPLNSTRIDNALTTASGIPTNNHTISRYLSCLEDSFILSHAQRYDVRGRHYLDFPVKYYATDTGLRNARINFRQTEKTHLMENVIYNELLRRGYSVDVGIFYMGLLDFLTNPKALESF